MRLFENECINITRIFTVEEFRVSAEDEEIREYSASPNTYELIFFLEGHNTTRVDGSVFEDLPGCLRYLPKGQMRGTYLVTRRIPSRCIDIFFDTDSPMPDRACSFGDFDGLRDRFLKIYHIFQSKRPGYYVQSMQTMYEIIDILHKSGENYLTAATRAQMQKAYDYLLENYRDPKFDYTALSAAAGLKYSHFSELFRRVYRMSPNRMVTDMRIGYAKELLVTSRHSVGEVAVLSGFENVYYFSSVFKKKTGFSPTGYLASIVSKNHCKNNREFPK